MSLSVFKLSYFMANKEFQTNKQTNQFDNFLLICKVGRIASLCIKQNMLLGNALNSL